MTSALLIFVSLCGQLELELSRAKAVAHLAIAAAAADVGGDVTPDTPDEPDKPNKPDPNCKKCRGTGMQPSGDGLGKVPCDCFEGDPDDNPDDNDDPDDRPDPPAPKGCQCGCGLPDCHCGRPVNSMPPAVKASAAALNHSAPAKGRRVLFFTASWCDPCKPVKAVVEALPKELFGTATDSPLQIIDTDANPGLTAAYGITGMPCLVVLDNGVETARYRGGVECAFTKDTLAALVTGTQSPPNRPTTPVQSAAPSQSGPRPPTVYYTYPVQQPVYQQQYQRPAGLLQRLFQRKK